MYNCIYSHVVNVRPKHTILPHLQPLSTVCLSHCLLPSCAEGIYVWAPQLCIGTVMFLDHVSLKAVDHSKILLVIQYIQWSKLHNILLKILLFLSNHRLHTITCVTLLDLSGDAMLKFSFHTIFAILILMNGMSTLLITYDSKFGECSSRQTTACICSMGICLIDFSALPCSFTVLFR